MLACLLLLSCRIAPSGALIGPSLGKQPWWLVRSTHFTLHADVGAAEARELAVELERIYNTLFELGFPLEKDPNFHTDVIVFQTKEEYEAVGPMGSTGYFTHRFGAWGVSAPTFLTFGGLAAAARPTLVHELTHRFVQFTIPQVPRWLNEGLAEYYSSVAVESGKAVLGRTNQVFKRGSSWQMGGYGVPVDALLSFQDLSTLDPVAFYAARNFPNDDKSTAAKEARNKQHGNYMSAWATVHTLKNGPPDLRTRFENWIHKMSTGAPAQISFEEAFQGVSAEDVNAQVRAVLNKLVLGDIVLLSTDFEAKGAPPLEDRALTPAEVHRVWGWAHLERGKAGLAEAKRSAEAALKEDPTGAESHLLMAAAQMASRERAAAYGSIQEAVRADSAFAPAALALFDFERLFNELEGRAKAGALLAKWLPLAKNSLTLNNFAWYLAMTGKSEDALAAARKAVQIDPSNAFAVDTLAAALFRSGNYKAAIEAEEQAVGLSGERGSGAELLHQADLYRAVHNAVVLWKKRPEPGQDPEVLPFSVIAAIRATQGPFVQDCYEKALKTNPTLEGSVVVRYDVTTEGKVMNPTLVPESDWDKLKEKPTLPPLPNAKVTACVVEQVSAVRYPPSSQGTQVTTPYSFKPVAPKQE